jgi:hypothetical protein
LNRQGRKTETGERFTANQVGSYAVIAISRRICAALQMETSSPLGGWASGWNRGDEYIEHIEHSSFASRCFTVGEQATPGAPWQIRITDELRVRIEQRAAPEYLPMLKTTMKLGVSRQTVLQRVKRGELEEALVRQGRRKGSNQSGRSAASAIRRTFMNQGRYEAVSKKQRTSASRIQLTFFRMVPTQNASNASSWLRPGRNP